MFMKNVGVMSLGCPKNRLDTEVMLGLLHAAGYVLVPEDLAELIIVNTCGFIQEAKEEAIETTLEAARYKDTARCRFLIMAGCFSQRYVYEAAAEFPEVDFFMGVDDVPHIVSICRQLENGTASSRISATLLANRPSQYLYDHTVPRTVLGARHSVYLKISEGCRYRCSFCAIPLIRGSLRSRSMQSVLSEASALVETGTSEILLIAQDTTSYGIDRGGTPLIVPLLQRLSDIRGLQWIRLMYAYPSNFDLPLMQLMAERENICSYIDLPLQHIDDSILHAMRRGVSEQKTRHLLEQLRREIPGLVLRSSLIVGFPGETDAVFQKLEDFVRDTRFDRLGVFAYSHEEGTPACDLPGQIPAEVAQERRQQLMRIQQEISLQKNQSLIGSVQNVLIDGVSRESDLLLEGRLQGQAPDIDGVVYITEGNTEQGRFEKVLVTEALPYDLVGKILSESSESVGKIMIENA
ncbi:30S ribosomal protein S12 methylthiotransferase RimO [candidate division KSB3 bacterium]|uniref:Ribosomal protein uS12 methylthiotransferase RimO n=1 Tax=candidate division KSB3 bacterium TaxID=2044937 RepID=A0A2G6E683_9BACT|nr:MAG: 30S ribosomal protein S12 methylthiotransferase RimO [candidate division KSB3 bacterium]PIE29891.1 MAG: 30S ribosomal protein S12 methylthiotransferase RimO [candidate division KSB3 bacterium]